MSKKIGSVLSVIDEWMRDGRAEIPEPQLLNLETGVNIHELNRIRQDLKGMKIITKEEIWFIPNRIPPPFGFRGLGKSPSSTSTPDKIYSVPRYEWEIDESKFKELKEVCEEDELLKTSLQKQKMVLNPQTGVISFGDIIHKFQRGMRGETGRLLLFKKLWDERRFIKNGIEKIKGKTLPPEFLAVKLNITNDATAFSRNAKAKSDFFGIIKGINRILKDKGFPAKIERQNGIQLVITEK